MLYPERGYHCRAFLFYYLDFFVQSFSAIEGPKRSALFGYIVVLFISSLKHELGLYVLAGGSINSVLPGKSDWNGVKIQIF